VSKKKPPRAAKSVPAAEAAPAAQPANIELEARVTIVQAAVLHRTLSARLAQGGPIVVDGTRVQEIDTAILQLLTSLWRSSIERGVACTWQGASDTLRRSAALIGVDEILRFPVIELA
jgi:anti-anti-sigma regulatory factor